MLEEDNDNGEDPNIHRESYQYGFGLKKAEDKSKKMKKKDSSSFTTKFYK